MSEADGPSMLCGGQWEGGLRNSNAVIYGAVLRHAHAFGLCPERDHMHKY